MNYKILCLISMIVMVSFILTSCDVDTDSDNDEYGDTVLRGKVIDKLDSVPLYSVLLTLRYSELMGMTQYKDLEPLTDSLGSFYINIYCEQSYSYSLSFSKEGYIYNDYPVTIDKGKDNHFFIEMIKDTIKVK